MEEMSLDPKHVGEILSADAEQADASTVIRSSAELLAPLEDVSVDGSTLLVTMLHSRRGRCFT